MESNIKFHTKNFKEAQQPVHFPTYQDTAKEVHVEYQLEVVNTH